MYTFKNKSRLVACLLKCTGNVDIYIKFNKYFYDFYSYCTAEKYRKSDSGLALTIAQRGWRWLLPKSIASLREYSSYTARKDRHPGFI